MLTLNYANCLSTRVGAHGLDAARLAPGSDASDAIVALTSKLQQTRGKGWERWRDLPFGEFRKGHVDAVNAAVASCKGRFDNCVVLGIGGSALGNIALHAALNPVTYNLLPAEKRNGPRLFVVDNVDPQYFGSILDFCKHSGGLERTLFNVVSKSGETAETASQFMVIRDALKAAMGDGFKRNIVAVTDPAKGTMRQICDKDGYTTLPVPDGVGGRFSVLSPVGLFSAALTGIDINALLDGAAEMDARCSVGDLSKNPAAMLATLLCELGQTKGKSNHVMMPYSNALYFLADWFRQLWAESLGKQYDVRKQEVFAGFTPIKALGATDQHSQVQLYREGPNDKVFGLVEVQDFNSHPHPTLAGRGDMTIPTGLGIDATRYLEGKRMGGLLNAEKRATEYALVESQRPNFTISMPRIDAHHVGQFIAMWEITTAYAGLMLGIDAYDQPAVELGKQGTFGLMGRAGFESFKTKVEQTLSPSTYVM